jgi:hypothetical protein
MRKLRNLTSAAWRWGRCSALGQAVSPATFNALDSPLELGVRRSGRVGSSQVTVQQEAFGNGCMTRDGNQPEAGA